MMKRMLSIRSFGELKRKTKAGMDILKMSSAEVAKLDLNKAAKVK